MAYIYICVVYTIIIFTYKYLEQCFTSITYYSSYWSSCNFVTIFNKISPTILGFAHMLEDPYKISQQRHSQSGAHDVKCPALVKYTSLNRTQEMIITSYAQETHTHTLLLLPHYQTVWYNRQLAWHKISMCRKNTVYHPRKKSLL